jgi:hypothetical protein
LRLSVRIAHFLKRGEGSQIAGKGAIFSVRVLQVWYVVCCPLDGGRGKGIRGRALSSLPKRRRCRCGPAESVGCSRDEEYCDVARPQKPGLMITRFQFPLRCHPVDSSTGWVHKVVVLGSFGRRLCDGDINGKDTRRGVNTSTWLASDGYVSWTNGWREWGM